SAGTPQLRKAVAAKLERDNGIKVSPEQVIVSCGAKQSVYNSMQVLLDPGDEVILVAPYWMTYTEQIRLAGGTPVVVHADAADGFLPDYQKIKDAVTPRTKAILINSPSNPTGAVWPRETIKQVAALALRHGLWIVTDEIYEKLIYGGTTHVSIASLSGEVADRTITINGCSKTYSMTGWRIGYAAAPLPVAKAMSNLQDQVTSNPTTFAQMGAIVALQLPSESVESMRSEFEARRDLIVRLLREIPGVSLEAPHGAFYVLPSFAGVLSGKIRTDFDLADYLLEKVHVATIPGAVFEAPGHLRLSYATSRADIERGVARIAEALQQLPT
ncbi:MAG TPA: pyridoxal phosphate-dependent aminotransferase, partial [Fimbriimonas sp.]|nr:pyridoxal phosphate-dependent aminotransferase [Fimbriimonas sp.]